MSKKIAEGIDALVLDVKFGSGAFMPDQEKAEELATALMKIAKGYGKKVSALITNMDQPLGRYSGNSLEVEECVAILKNESHHNRNGYDTYSDTRELSLQLSAHMLWLGGAATSIDGAYHLAQVTLGSGRAYEKFEELCRIHGGNLKALPKPKNKYDVLARENGLIEHMQTDQIGIAGIQIRAGREKTTDVIEPTAGIEFHAKVGDQVQAGEVLFTVYGEDLLLLKTVEERLIQAVKISKAGGTPQPLISKILL